MRKFLIASIFATTAALFTAAPASAQTVQQGNSANVSTTPNIGAPVLNLACLSGPGSRACAESQRSKPTQQPSASNNRQPQPGGGPRPTRPRRR